MPLKKQEFYEGAALHLLVRSGRIERLTYSQPFFHLNEDCAVLLKYSTKGRSPWAFTFMPDEQAALVQMAAKKRTVVALVCGSDGVASFSFEELQTISNPLRVAFHVACYRQHGQHYE